MGKHKNRIVGALLTIGGVTITAVYGWGVERMMDWLSSHFEAVAHVSRQNLAGSSGLALVIAGVTIALWPSRKGPNKIEALATSMWLLAADLERMLRRNSMQKERVWPEILADCYALRIRLEKLGFETPRFLADADQFEIATWMHRYLVSIGALLRDGNVKEAREMAISVCANIPKSAEVGA
jgi:hypothetical protein